MINLHPPLTGLPFAGAVSLVALEVLGCVRRYKERVSILRPVLIVACIVGVMAAFLSGYQASSRVGELSEATEGLLAQHHSLGRLVFLASGLMGAFFFVAERARHGKRLMYGLYYVFLLVYAISTLVVGQLGGDLVFGHGVGVAR
jgi:uncharacterized membrane protein